MDTKNVNNIEGYQITSDGKIYSNKTNRYLKLCPSGYKMKYLQAKLYDPKTGYHYKNVHRLVAEHFIKNEDKTKTQVNHIDGNTLNNDYTNLEWVTPKQNMEHAVNNGLLKMKGEQHHFVKLNEIQVREIKLRLKNGECYRKISKDYPVTQQTIHKIKQGTRWGHIII